MTPCSSASSGLRSTSRTCGRSAASCRLDQHQRDRGLVGSRNVAIGLELTRHAGAGNQCAREREVERRQREGLVVDDLDRRAARPEHYPGPKVGSSAMPAMSSGRRAARSWEDRDALDTGIGPQCSPAQRCRPPPYPLHRIGEIDRTPPTSDLWTMSGDWILSTTGWPALRNGVAAATAASASGASVTGVIGSA